MKNSLKLTGRTLLAAALVVAMAACNGKSNQQQVLQERIDSLSQSDSLHAEDIESMADFINIMSEGLDSISGASGQLTPIGPEVQAKDKAQLREQLSSIAALIARQRDRITALEEQLKSSNTGYAAKISKLIAYYKEQLDAKDQTIAQLNADLEGKNANIAQLSENVQKLSSTNADLNRTVETQQSTLAAQDATLNEGYVQIGTTKELKEKGVIKGGFLAKKKVDVSSLNASGFTKIDIRRYNDVRLPSTNPKIMTQMPASSYTITRNDDATSTLHINDPQAFWSVSKYLVVRL